MLYTNFDKQTLKPSDFIFGVIGLAHGHIYDMTDGLLKAGAKLRWVYDPSPEKVQAFLKQYPQAKVARCEEEVLSDSEARLVAAAAIPCDRAALGVRVMESGKDYFTDKTPLISLEQLDMVKAACAQTKKRYFVFYSERLCSKSAVCAAQIIAQGRIGQVIQVMGMGPHRLGPPESRPDWFYKKAQYGGILCDIGSHQIEQYLYFSGAKDASIMTSHVANYNHPEFPELEDFGEVSLVGDNGTSGYFRIDWFTPDGLHTWGDGRTFILGTDGYLELRKYINVGVSTETDHVFLVDHQGEHVIEAAKKAETPFFGQMLRDCLERTETAMTQAHIFKAAELCVRAQMAARVLKR